MKKVLIAIIALFPFLWGCAAISQKVMPSEGRPAVSQWKNYQSALDVFKKIEPGKTSLADLKKLGFDPDITPNTTFLNPITIRNLFLGTDTKAPIKFEDLPQDIQDYLKDFNNCLGFKFEQEVSYTEGKGSLVKRWLKFKKEDLTTGWRFEALIFMKKDTVAYVYWEGKPNIKDPRFKKDPLGPLTDIFGNIPGLIFKLIP